jgi:hypothetical protein
LLMRALTRWTARVPRASAALIAVEDSAATAIPLERQATLRRARPEAAAGSPTRRLSDREVRTLTLDGRLAFVFRELRANQLSMDRAFFNTAFGFLGGQCSILRRSILRRGATFVFVRRIADAERGPQLVFRGDVSHRRGRLVHDFFRRDRDRRGKRRQIALATLTRNLGVLVLVIGIARRAARLLHVLGDHRHDDVVRETALPRTVVVQNVTKPKLALLLHQETPDGSSLAGKGIAKGDAILAELVF